MRTWLSLTLVGLLLCGSPIDAAITAGVVDTEASPDDNVVTTTAIDTVGASLIVACIADYGGATASVLTDSAGNIWTVDTERIQAAGGRIRIAWVAGPTTSATHTFTATQTGSFPALAVRVFAGTHATPSDAAGTGANTPLGTTTAQPGSITPSEDNELVVVCTATSNSSVAAVPTINGGFSTPDAIAFVPSVNIGVGLSYLIQTTAAAANPLWTWTTNGTGGNAIHAFKAAAAGGVVVKRGTLSGVLP